MQQALVVSKVEIDELLKRLPSEEAQRTLSLIDALKVFDRSSDKKRCALEIASRLEPLGYKGLSLKSLYRKLDQFRRIGVWACVDRRVARRVMAQGLAANAPLVREWHARVLSCRRKIKTAWRTLLEDLAGGCTIPGIGTWRDLYAATYGYRPAADEPCPWSVLNPPPGWSLRNLTLLNPDKFALKAARIGMGVAKIDFLPAVRLTRVGLLPCQVIEVDDMWYEHMVVMPGNSRPQRVVEFAAMDRLTGHVICHFAKPIAEAPDGTRKTLKSAWVRYLYHYLLCVVGVPAAGCVIKGEHGTAAQDDTFASALSAINALREANGQKPIVFRAGSIVTEPLAKGLPGVAHHGNPRHKGMIEQMHATLKNYADALVFGNVGGGRGLQPEETAGMVREDAALAALAPDAGTIAKLHYNFPTWSAFVQIAEEAHRRMDNRSDHALEGWEECGFLVGEWRLAGAPHWTAMPRFATIPPDRQAQLRILLDSGAAEYRERRMSPAEAWTAATRATPPEPLSPGFAPMILGRELAHAGTVGDKLTIPVRDAETGERYTVCALVDGAPLPRGAKVLVWVNPMDAGKAYLADPQGRFLGVASTLLPARADADADIPELQRQLGLRSAALAEERRRLAPLVKDRLAKRNAATAHNLETLGVDDPVAAATERAAADAVLADDSDANAAPAADRDLLPPPLPPPADLPDASDFL